MYFLMWSALVGFINYWIEKSAVKHWNSKKVGRDVTANRRRAIVRTFNTETRASTRCGWQWVFWDGHLWSPGRLIQLGDSWWCCRRCWRQSYIWLTYKTQACVAPHSLMWIIHIAWLRSWIYVYLYCIGFCLYCNCIVSFVCIYS